MNEIINDIINTINNSEWNTNKKIRYAYLELGKYLHKNVEFFYTLFNKLKTGSYTAEEIRNVYTNEFATDNVICRDVAKMLKFIFDNCGIYCEIRKFCKVEEYIIDGESVFIQHYVTIVKGEEDKKYFLTLVPDLANIQLGFSTEHFATNIEYLDMNGNQIYEGDKIENSIMSKEELKKIDAELGFLSLNFDNSLEYMDQALEKLSVDVSHKNVSPLIRCDSNRFYMGLIKILNISSGSNETECLDCEMSKISDLNWNYIKKYIYSEIMMYISSQYNYDFLSNNWALILKTPGEMYKQLNDLFKDINDDSVGLFNIKAIVANLCKMIEVIEKLKDINDYTSEEFLKLKLEFDRLIDKLGVLFVDKNYIFVEGKKFTNGYIINKLKCYLPLIFDFGNQTKFSKMNIGEQVVILDKVLERLLFELRNDQLIPREQSNFLNNRTYRTVIKNIETGNYLYMILIHAAGEYGNKVLIYDFESNTIKGFDENLSFVQFVSEGKYEVLSDQIYIEVEKMEEYKRNNMENKKEL